MTFPRPSGWYPNPSGAAGLMYWDGRAWHTSVVPSRPPSANKSAAKTAGSLAIGLTGAMIMGVVVLGVLAVVLVASLVVINSRMEKEHGPAPIVTDTGTPPSTTPFTSYPTPPAPAPSEATSAPSVPVPAPIPLPIPSR